MQYASGLKRAVGGVTGRQKRGWMWKGVSPPHWVALAAPPPQRFFEFSSLKNAGFMLFYCEKLLVAKNRLGSGGA